MTTPQRRQEDHPRPYALMCGGWTFGDAMTASVSVVSGAHDNEAVRGSEVRGCTQMIAGRRTD